MPLYGWRETDVMTDFLVAHYAWIKALHIISVIAWMAGMLYLPRLYVYHCAAEPGSVQSETFKVMERRLLRAIINPAMGAAFLFAGLMLVAQPALFGAGWFHVKLVLIVAMTAFHGFLSRWRKDFAADRNRRPARFYRLMNEVPTVLMIGIVILAVVKPI
jgi:putative membrane protein